MYNSKTAVFCAALLAASSVAQAEEEKKESPWTASVELGFIRTTGNTETTTSAGKADVAYEVEKWRHTGHAEAYGQESKDQTTGENVVSAERYELSFKSDYKFTDRDYAYGFLKSKKDRFSGFHYENEAGLGYGRKAIKRDDMELDLEIGPGVRYFREDVTPDPDPDPVDEAELNLSANFWWAITDNSKFTQDLHSNIGESFTESKSVTGISANINKTLAMKFTYTVRHKSKVPAGIEKTDTEAAMTLVYTF